jgi:siroheme synthase-like protein
VSLVLTGRRVVVVGGGEVATRRVQALLAAGAGVEVVAPALSERLEALERDGRVTVTRRAFLPSDLDEAWLAFAATDDVEVNRAVVDAATERRCFASSAQAGTSASANPMSVLRRGDVEVAVGTSGRSPALAAWLRRRLEPEVGPEYGVLCDLVAEAREECRAAGETSEVVDWYAAFDSGILDLIRTGRLDQAREGLRTCLSSSSG